MDLLLQTVRRVALLLWALPTESPITYNCGSRVGSRARLDKFSHLVSNCESRTKVVISSLKLESERNWS